MEEKDKNQKITEKKELAGAEMEIAKDISKTEEKVGKKEITQKQADKEINNKVKDEIEKVEEKKETQKKPEIKNNVVKKTEAVVNGKNVPISTKQAVAICNYIKRKDIDKAIFMLEEVKNFKKAVPMKGELPHRKGKIMSGRYPINAVSEFIKLLKSLKSNNKINELELEKYVLFCKANIAPRPYRRFGRTKFKRTHVTLKLIPVIKKQNKTKEIKK